MMKMARGGSERREDKTHAFDNTISKLAFIEALALMEHAGKIEEFTKAT